VLQRSLKSHSHAFRFEERRLLLGVKSTTWALSKRVKSWDTLVYVPLENNYEYVHSAS